MYKKVVIGIVGIVLFFSFVLFSYIVHKDKFTQADFDATVNHFNESNWLILQSEFETVIRVEIGAIINDNDQFDWKFKK